MKLRLVDRTEKLHFFLNGSFDCFKAGVKKLSGVKAFEKTEGEIEYPPKEDIN